MVAPGPYHDLTRVAAELSWALFFGPFALLGLYALVRACLVFYRAPAARGTPEAIEILPAWPGAATEAGEGGAARRFRTSSPINEPLDDVTRRRLDRLAGLAVKVSGILVGTIFVGLGLAGLLWAWTQERQALPRGNSLIAVLFPTVSGVSVLMGAYILRETFARPETAWLTPLRIFTAIVSKKLIEEEKEQKGPAPPMN